jgi:hypothetical protein
MNMRCNGARKVSLQLIEVQPSDRNRGRRATKGAVRAGVINEVDKDDVTGVVDDSVQHRQADQPFRHTTN